MQNPFVADLWRPAMRWALAGGAVAAPAPPAAIDSGRLAAGPRTTSLPPAFFARCRMALPIRLDARSPLETRSVPAAPRAAEDLPVNCRPVVDPACVPQPGLHRCVL